MMEAGYLLALTTGFLGGFGHCIGMCGPLVGSSALHTASARQGSRLSIGGLHQLLYHAGRLTSYGFVGALMGLAGSFVNVATRLAGIQNGVMVSAGIIMIVMGFGIIGLLGKAGRLERHSTLVLGAAKKLFNVPSGWKYYPIGLVLGLLPCGLSYTAFIAAAGTGAPFKGMLVSLLFGLGTVPALMLFGLAVSYAGSRMRMGVQKAGGVAVAVMGVYYVLKGIRLYVEM